LADPDRPYLRQRADRRRELATREQAAGDEGRAHGPHARQQAAQFALCGFDLLWLLHGPSALARAEKPRSKSPPAPQNSAAARRASQPEPGARVLGLAPAPDLEIQGPRGAADARALREVVADLHLELRQATVYGVVAIAV